MFTRSQHIIRTQTAKSEKIRCRSTSW